MNVPTVINALSIIKGEFVLSTDTRVDGHMIGKVETKKDIVIGSVGLIKGFLQASNMGNFGNFFGVAIIRGNTSLYQGSYLSGKLYTNHITVQEGSRIHARVISLKNLRLVLKTNCKVRKMDEGLRSFPYYTRLYLHFDENEQEYKKHKSFRLVIKVSTHSNANTYQQPEITPASTPSPVDGKLSALKYLSSLKPVVERVERVKILEYLPEAEIIPTQAETPPVKQKDQTQIAGPLKEKSSTDAFRSGRIKEEKTRVAEVATGEKNEPSNGSGSSILKESMLSSALKQVADSDFTAVVSVNYPENGSDHDSHETDESKEI